jgi:hypothetical protein
MRSNRISGCNRAQSPLFAERAQEHLHEVTRILSNLAMHAMNVPARSNATEVLVDAKSILRLNNPINVRQVPHVVGR